MEREHETIIAAASTAGAGIVIRGGAAKGAPSADKQKGLQWERWKQASLDGLRGDMAPMELILRFTFSNPDLDTTIVGTANPAHLRDNLEILRKALCRQQNCMRKPSAALPLLARRPWVSEITAARRVTSRRDRRPKMTSRLNGRACTKSFWSTMTTRRANLSSRF